MFDSVCNVVASRKKKCPSVVKHRVQVCLVDGGVPVEGLVLLHVPRVAGGGAQVLEADLRPHGAVRHGAVEAVHVVTQTLPSLGTRCFKS